MTYGPIIDGSITKNPILPVPIDKFHQNDADIPIIIGHTTDESLLTFLGITDKLYYIVFKKRVIFTKFISFYSRKVR